MKSNGLILAVVVLAALTGVLYWSNRHRATDADSDVSVVQGTADKLPTVLSLVAADVQKVEIKRKGQDEMVFTRNGAGPWQMTAPKPLDANQDSLRDMVSEFSSLQAERVIDDKGVDLASYGLAPPAIEVDLTDKNNKTQTVLIGDDAPTGGTNYVAVKGDPRVFMASVYAKTTVNKSPDELRDQRLLRIDVDKLTRVELIANNHDIEMDHDKDGWTVGKPKPQRADPAQVEVLLNNLMDAKFDAATAPDQKANAAAFDAGTPAASAKMMTGPAMQELQVRKNKDDYYAKSNAVEGYYKVPSDLVTAMSKGLGDLQNRRLFDLNLGDPDEGVPPAVDKIEMQDGPKAYDLTRSGRDWWSNGKKMQGNAVSYLLEAIRNLNASKFADSGFTQPQITISVTMAGGKVTQTSQIAKNGSDYLAKRGDETTLYELDANNVQELETAADNVKPAPGP